MKNRLASDPVDATLDLFPRAASSAKLRSEDAELLALAREIVAHDPILADILLRASCPVKQN